jgi:hypothetical protein
MTPVSLHPFINTLSQLDGISHTRYDTRRVVPLLLSCKSHGGNQTGSKKYDLARGSGLVHNQFMLGDIKAKVNSAVNWPHARMMISE